MTALRLPDIDLDPDNDDWPTIRLVRDCADILAQPAARPSHHVGWRVSATSYKRGCHCQRCTAANTVEQREYRQRRPRQAVDITREPPAGCPDRPRRSLKVRADGMPYTDTWPGKP